MNPRIALTLAGRHCDTLAVQAAQGRRMPVRWHAGWFRAGESRRGSLTPAGAARMLHRAA